MINMASSSSSHLWLFHFQGWEQLEEFRCSVVWRILLSWEAVQHAFTLMLLWWSYRVLSARLSCVLCPSSSCRAGYWSVCIWIRSVYVCVYFHICSDQKTAVCVCKDSRCLFILASLHLHPYPIFFIIRNFCDPSEYQQHFVIADVSKPNPQALPSLFLSEQVKAGRSGP